MTPRPTGTRLRSRVVGVLTTVSGFALFWYFIRRVGGSDVVAGIMHIGWAFLLVLVLSGFRFVARSLAWMRCMRKGHGLRLYNVMAAFLTGDAIGNLVPLSVVVGEPIKALYLRERAPLRHTLPALAVEALFYTLSIVVVIIAGGVTLFLLLQPPAEELLIAAVPLIALTLLVTGSHWLIWKRIPLASGTVRRLAHLGIAAAFFERLSARVSEIESHIQRDYPRDWSQTMFVAVFHTAFHLLAVVEIYLVLSFIGERPPTLIDAFVFEAANRFINVVFKFVPLRIGVDEASTAAFAELLEFGVTAGVTMAVVRKGRMLIWSAIGVALLARRGLSLKALEAQTRLQESGDVVVVMARNPHGRRVPKSRLRDTIPEDAIRRRIYAAFLKDTIVACQSLPDTSLRIAYVVDGSIEWFTSVGISSAELLAQRGNDLGNRERHVFDVLFNAGFSRVVMIGSDLPTLPLTHITDAFELINPSSVVLGPSTDGGYYLMGLGSPPNDGTFSALFTGVRWGTAIAFDDTVKAAEQAGITVEKIKPWYDVDDADGLLRLQRDLERTEHSRRAPVTTRVIRELLENRRE